MTAPKRPRGSRRFVLDASDYKSILISFLLGLSGVIGTYTIEYIRNVDFGQWGPVITAAIPVFVSIFRRWITDRRTQ